MELIKVVDLKKQYGEAIVTPVLFGLNFKINAGEFVAIMGPSGSGKSTLMHILGFLDTATSGKYLFAGENVSEFDDDKLARNRNQKVGFVFQAFNLLPRTTVFENVKLPLVYSDIAGEKEKKEKTDTAIKSVNLEHRSDYRTSQLSGGEKQRVAIARALVNDPAVIFADEPTGNLDSKSGSQIMEILEKLNNNGKTIILVTHEHDTARHAKRIIHLKDGRIISDEMVADRKKASDGLFK
ncbi:ABC transporter ATP-binding protein [Candidatus Parcubacteria bacterium]|nr:MAG: ABC transporter ATP-binding protein [Candidatus Parcubacteria bacterium]